MHYGTPGERLRMLDEYIQCVRGLLTQERTTFDGEFFTLTDAQCEPKPVQARLPIWIGGGGEKVTLRIAARARRRLERAVHPARRVGAQGRRCSTSTARRSAAIPATITKTVNVGMAFTDEELKRQFGPMANYVKPGVLSGSVQEMVDKVGAYVAAGAEWVILAMRAPFDRDGLERFAAEVMPAGARLTGVTARRTVDAGSRHISHIGGPSSGTPRRTADHREAVAARRSRRCVPSCSREYAGMPVGVAARRAPVAIAADAEPARPDGGGSVPRPCR